jgi:quercetin dioxygenase-like cupin family protein
MKILRYTDVKAEEADEGASRLRVRWLITKDAGAQNFAMRLFEMEPGGHSPLHAHAWEHEVFVLEGEGTVIGDGGEKPIKPGNAVFVPPNERHQFRNEGKKTLKFLCVVPYREK